MNKQSFNYLSYWLVILFTISIASSCTKDSMPQTVFEDNEQSNPYRIPEKEAIASLQDFLNSSTGYSPSPTKSGVVNDRLRGKKIGKVQYLTTSSSFRKLLSNKTEQSIRTKIHEIDPGGPLPDSIIIPDTLIYVVNFDDDGFAVLSADNRISSTIIAVVESGSLSPDDFNLCESLLLLCSDTSITYEYNSWGVDSDGDELGFEDSLNTSNYEEEMILLDTTLTGFTPNEMIIELVSDYVVNELLNPTPPSPGNGIDPGEQWQNPESGQSGQEGGGPSAGNGGVITCEWVTTAEVPAMLSTIWFQGAPLNQFCPTKTFSSGNTYIGCGGVAMGQILAYNEYPVSFYLDNYYVDWSLLKSVYTLSNPSPNNSEYYFAINLLSRYLYSIARICETHFWDIGSWALASKCKRALHAAQYTNIHKYCSYREDKILTMLNNDSPVFIQALQRLRLFPITKIIDGHSWVIDGYRTQQFTGNNGTIYDSRTLVHCNWGWSGQYDGYYESKLFKIGEGVENVAPGDESLEGLHYRWNYRIITYDKPNN